jgi:uncharacterized membrane protein
MRPAGLYFFPLARPFVLALFVCVGLLILLIEINILRYAYQKLGVHHRYIFLVLLLSLVGSYVNIPVAEFPARHVLSGQEVSYFGMRYVIPFVEERPRTVLAVNVGGAVLPALLSLYLLAHHELYLHSLVGVAVVAAMTHWMAQPIEGVGIVVPMFLPPLVAAGSALLLSRDYAPSLAYSAGSLGTLIGADLLNLDKIHGLGAPVVSIGGAGTFDGVFLTGILAVLLA